MKMTRIFALLCMVAALAFFGCQKEKKTNPNTDSTNIQQLANDENQYQSADDELMTDVETVMTEPLEKSTGHLPCNVEVTRLPISNDTLTVKVHFFGLNCPGTKSRFGNVYIKRKVGEKWINPGAAVVIQVDSLKITRIRTGKWIIINGKKVHRNITGGNLRLLGDSMTSVVYRTRGNMQVTFDDNTTRIWNVARQKTFTGVLGSLVMTVDGIGEAHGMNNLVIWGVNRQGDSFYTQIQQSVVHQQLCDFDPVSGMKFHSIPADEKTALVTFGYNSDNQPIAPGECPTKFKLDWTKDGNSGTVYLWLP